MGMPPAWNGGWRNGGALAGSSVGQAFQPAPRSNTSSEQGVNRAGRLHAGQALVEALEAEGEALVVDAQAAQHRGVQVRHAGRVLGDVVTEVVGLAVHLAALD